MSVAVCCFNDADSGESKPLAFAFEPLYRQNRGLYPRRHDGNAPVPTPWSGSITQYLWQLFNRDKAWCTIHYTDQIPADLRPYLLDHRWSDCIKKHGDGDFTS